MKMRQLLFLTISLFPLLLPAEETRVTVGSRSSTESPEKRIQNEEMLEEERQASGFIFDKYPSVYFSSSHHWLVAVTLLDNDKFTLELEDGSVWKVSKYDGNKALNWKVNDPLTLTQNNRWFPNYDYRIVNRNNGSSVEANLFLGPVERGAYTRYIISIDRDRREIVLSDNTHWEISYLDASIFKDWALSDAVIIGSNSSWDSDSEALLINVNMNNSARAKQY